MSSLNLVLHGIAIKKHASPSELSGITGLSTAEIEGLLMSAKASNRAVEAQGKYMLTPLMRLALESSYSRRYLTIRKNAAFMASYEAFERINIHLKALITDWQTLTIGGQRVPNDHSDKSYDAHVIDQLGDLHDRVGPILSKLAVGLPRLKHYLQQLQAAIEKAEDGAIEWVSNAKIESYHTLWFELHEDLLRIVGRSRVE